MVTIKDVARAAKVSVATVSRVINGSGPVKEETRRLIREDGRTEGKRRKGAGLVADLIRNARNM